MKRTLISAATALALPGAGQVSEGTVSQTETPAVAIATTTAVETFVAGVIGLAAILGTWNAAAEPVVRVYAETAAADGSLADINLVQAVADLRYPVRRYCELSGIPGVDIHPMRPGYLDRNEGVDLNMLQCLADLVVENKGDIGLVSDAIRLALERNPGEKQIDRIIVDSGALRLVGVELADGRSLSPELEPEDVT